MAAAFRIAAESLEGGLQAWGAGAAAGPAAKLPSRGAQGRTVWVTRRGRRSTASPAPG